MFSDIQIHQIQSDNGGGNVETLQELVLQTVPTVTFRILPQS